MALFSILILATFLRFLNLGESLWLDEATSGLVVRNFDLGGILHQFLPGDFHPPLYYFTLKAWSELFGTSEVALRALSLLFGTLSVWLLYKLVSSIYSKSTALLAALFLAINPLHVYYSIEARMYSMLTFLVILSFWFFIKLVYTNSQKNTWKAWLGFSINLVLVVMTDYVGGFVIPAFILIALWLKKDSRFYIKLILSFVPLLLAFILYWSIFKLQLDHGLGVETEASGWWQILGQPSLKNIILIPVKFMLGRINYESRALYGFWILLSGTLWVMPIFWALKKDKKAKIFFLWAVTSVAVSIIVGFFIPVVVYFRLIYVLPVVVALLAIGFQKFPSDLFLPFLVVFLFISLMFNYRYMVSPRFHREDWRAFSQYVKETDGELVFVANSQMEGLVYYNPNQPVSHYPEIAFNKDKIILMRYVADVFDPDNLAQKAVEERGYQKTAEHNFNGIVVWEYEHENSN